MKSALDLLDGALFDGDTASLAFLRRGTSSAMRYFEVGQGSLYFDALTLKLPVKAALKKFERGTTTAL